MYSDPTVHVHRETLSICYLTAIICEVRQPVVFHQFVDRNSTRVHGPPTPEKCVTGFQSDFSNTARTSRCNTYEITS